jgi:hypothetical protein
MEFSQAELELYKKALKEKVCSLCEKTGYKGGCLVGESGLCPVDYHLKELLTAVLTTPQSDKIADYVPGLRAAVCQHCDNQDGLGQCESREHAYCGLDSFFLLVVQTIEEAKAAAKAANG